VVFLWPELVLSPEERRVLELVLSQVGYFGRAESWCVARLLPEVDRVSPNCVPHGGAGEGGEAVRVLAAHLDTWAEWSFGRSARRPTPPWNLVAETADLHAERWSDPPGSRWVTYRRPADAFAVRPTASRPPSYRPKATLGRYALDATVLPSVSETLPLAEATRRALLARCRSSIFSGKDAEGVRLLTHGHAYNLPTDEDGDGRIDHINILATDGFGPQEVAALDRLRALSLGEGADYRLLLVGLGVPHDFNVPFLGRSRCWESATPFLASRHCKSRGQRKDPPDLRGGGGSIEFARLVLGEELARLRQSRPDIPEPATIDLLPENRIGRLRPLQFKRFRQKAGDDGGRRAAGAFRITFPEPITGPLVLGHSSHFGLGLFVPRSAEVDR
jgi:CRISPR-associated protein Csb2